MNNFEIRKSIYDDIRKNCNLITDNGIQLEIDLNFGNKIGGYQLNMVLNKYMEKTEDPEVYFML